MAESEKTHRVVIAGAGFAGLNAARELVQLVGATTEVRFAAGSYRVGASTLGREAWRQGEAAAKGGP
jgi:monoamine oxidase